jgi:hypothetical protein
MVLSPTIGGVITDFISIESISSGGDTTKEFVMPVPEAPVCCLMPISSFFYMVRDWPDMPMWTSFAFLFNIFGVKF